jgi:Fic family protein
LKRKSQKRALEPNCGNNTRNSRLRKPRPSTNVHDVGPDGFANGISTEKYVNLCRVSRATAYRELTALCEMGVLVQTGKGKGTRYQLKLAT